MDHSSGIDDTNSILQQSDEFILDIDSDISYEDDPSPRDQFEPEGDGELVELGEETKENRQNMMAHDQWLL